MTIASAEEGSVAAKSAALALGSSARRTGAGPRLMWNRIAARAAGRGPMLRGEHHSSSRDARRRLRILERSRSSRVTDARRSARVRRSSICARIEGYVATPIASGRASGPRRAPAFERRPRDVPRAVVLRRVASVGTRAMRDATASLASRIALGETLVANLVDSTSLRTLARLEPRATALRIAYRGRASRVARRYCGIVGPRTHERRCRATSSDPSRSFARRSPRRSSVD